MITEDYVSFEVAKLLKEKGFNEPCNAYWFHMIDAEPIFNGDMPRQVYNNKSDTIEIICCPTLQMAMRWLREVHNIAIVVTPSMFWGKYNVSLYKKGNAYPIGFDGDSLCPSYEQACESAIRCCLGNSI